MNTLCPRHRGQRARAVLAGAASMIALLVLPSLAAAEPCANLTPSPTQLIDPLGFVWDNTSDGEIADGGGVDAYDNANALAVAVGANPAAGYAPPDTNACTREDGGREIVFPEQDNNGLQVSRKLYVPGSGTGFARWLNVLRNPGGAPLTAVVTIRLGNIGSDAATKVVTSSSGDATMTVADAFAVTDDSLDAPLGAIAGDPALIHVWQSTAPGVDTADAMAQTFQVDTDGASVSFQSLTVPAGGTIIIMGVEAQRFTSAQASDGTAANLARGTAELYAGLSPVEQAAIVNWKAQTPPDGDNDGRLDSADNCPAVANPDQLNTDGDALGDACDTDDDNDTITDADESVRGTNALKPDTDGDGRDDKADTCPTQFGRGADGCADTVPPTTTVTTRSSLTLKAFRSGVRARAACNEACSIQFEVIGRASGSRLNAVNDIVLASRSFAQSTSARSAVLRPRAALIGAAKRFTVRLRVTSVDASGNRRVVTRAVRVR